MILRGGEGREEEGAAQTNKLTREKNQLPQSPKIQFPVMPLIGLLTLPCRIVTWDLFVELFGIHPFSEQKEREWVQETEFPHELVYSIDGKRLW